MRHFDECRLRSAGFGGPSGGSDRGKFQYEFCSARSCADSFARGRARSTDRSRNDIIDCSSISRRRREQQRWNEYERWYHDECRYDDQCWNEYQRESKRRLGFDSGRNDHGSLGRTATQELSPALHVTAVQIGDPR